MGCLSSTLVESVDTIIKSAGKDSSRNQLKAASKNLPDICEVVAVVRVLRPTEAILSAALWSIPKNRCSSDTIDVSSTIEDDSLSRTVFLSEKRSNSNNSPDFLSDSGSRSSTPRGYQKALASSFRSVRNRLYRGADGLKTNGLDNNGSSPVVANRNASFDEFIMELDDWNEPFIASAAPVAIVDKKVTVKTSVDKVEVVSRDRKQTLTPLKPITTNIDSQIARSMSMQPLSSKKFPLRKIASVGKNVREGFRESYTVGSNDDAYLSPKDKNVRSIIAQIESPTQNESSNRLSQYFSTFPQKSRYKTSLSPERNLSLSSSMGEVIQEKASDATNQRARSPSVEVYTSDTTEDVNIANISKFTLPTEHSLVIPNDPACKDHQISLGQDSLSTIDLKIDFSAAIAS
jgi:hypothetical protein